MIEKNPRKALGFDFTSDKILQNHSDKKTVTAMMQIYNVIISYLFSQLMEVSSNNQSGYYLS